MTAAILATVPLAIGVLLMLGDDIRIDRVFRAPFQSLPALFQEYPLRVVLGGERNGTSPSGAPSDVAPNPQFFKLDADANEAEDLGHKEGDSASSSLPASGGVFARAVGMDEAVTVAQASDDSSVFDQAFAEFERPKGQSRSSPVAKSGPKTLLGLDFRLENARSGADGFEVRKALRADGISKGKVTLRIVNDTTIMVKAADLSGALSTQSSKDRLSALGHKLGAFIDFDALRDAGFDVRYNASRDVVEVSSQPQ